ncbi:hypothetical protein AB0I66_11115 [Streptomyces sp. NPDC050439]|uniref:hypothetical protein n=1 Tax=unclassified Streptomyces TaxID=2593676 RepID=UPI003440B842
MPLNESDRAQALAVSHYLARWISGVAALGFLAYAIFIIVITGGFGAQPFLALLLMGFIASGTAWLWLKLSYRA